MATTAENEPPNPRDDAAAEPGAGPSGDTYFSSGERVGTWTVTSVVTHSEFRRYTFTGDDGAVVGVEVTDAAIARADTDSMLVVQPAPGSAAVPDVLATLVAERFMERSSDAARLGVDTTADERPQRGPPKWTQGAAATFVLFILLAFAWTSLRQERCSARCMGTVALAVAAWLVAFGLAVLAVPDMALFRDAIRDLALAHDCLRGFACGEGPVTSFAGLAQGALWPRVLAVSLDLGVPISGLRFVALGAFATAAALLTAHFRFERTSAPLALLVAGAWFLAVVKSDALHMFWNPVLIPVTSVLFVGLARRALRSGATVDHAAVGVALGLLIEAHVVAALFILPWLALTVVRAPAPVRAGAIALVGATSVHAAISPSAFERNLRVVTEGDLLGAMVVGTIVAVAFGAILRRRRGPQTSNDTVARDLFAVGLAFCALVIAFDLVTGHHFGVRYLAPSFGPIAVGVAGLATARRAAGKFPRTVSLVAVAVIAVGATFVARNVRPAAAEPVMGLSAVEQIVAELRSARSYDDLLWTLHSDEAPLLLGLVGATAPHLPAHAPSTAALGAFVRTDPPPDGLPENWSAIPLPRGRALVTGEWEPWVARDPLVVCHVHEESEVCEPIDRRDTVIEPSPWGGFHVARLGALASGENHRRGLTTSWHFRVNPGDGGQRRLLRLAIPVGAECSARIAAVEGVPFEGELPSDRVVLLGDGTRRGRMVIGIERDGPCQTWARFPPSWIETETPGPWLDALLSPLAEAGE